MPVCLAAMLSAAGPVSFAAASAPPADDAAGGGSGQLLGRLQVFGVRDPGKLQSELEIMDLVTLQDLTSLNEAERARVDAGLESAGVSIGDHSRFRRMLSSETDQVSAERRQLQTPGTGGQQQSGTCVDAQAVQATLLSLSARTAALEVVTHSNAAPTGSVVIWPGTSGPIPEGWVHSKHTICCHGASIEIPSNVGVAADDSTGNG